ncbi:MAG: ABC transporter permease [Nitrospinae bacterium]|nr:ABC transporter permease [Nitrospinota bacterium]
MRKTKTILVQRIILLVAIGLVWEAATGGLGIETALFEPIILAKPSLIAVDIYEYALSGLIVKDLLSTLKAAFLGLFLGIISGVVVGVLFGRWRTIADVMEPIMVGMNSLPRITVAPVMILWFGLGLTSKVVLALFTVFFVVFFNTFLGIRNVDPDLVKAVKTMGATPHQITRMVVIPSVASWIFAALRTSVSFALSGAVVGEFVGSTEGLGYRMLIALGLLETERVFSIMIILMLIGSVLVGITSRIERYLLRWRPAMAQME